MHVNGARSASSDRLQGHRGLMNKALVVGLVALSLPLASSAFAQHHAPLAESVDELPGEILIDLKDDATEGDVGAIMRDYGLADLVPNSKWSIDHDKFERAHVPTSKMASILARLSMDPRVEHAEPMSVLRATFVPNDPLYQEQWHMPRVGAEKAWEYTCGLGVTVAVVDTGVACYDSGPFTKGTDLAGTRCGGGWNFVDDKAEAYDDQGHGTHVAGTIAQTTNNGTGVAGLAHCAKLMPVKVLNEYGWGTVADVAEGIRWAADNGAQVMNLSLGGNIKSKILEDAVNHALSKGVIFVAAAGNSGRAVIWPAAYPGVIAVSASDEKDGLAWFSSRGPEVAIAAPGVRVTQQTVCDSGRNACEIFGAFNGTSMASPHVAGAAAMLVSQGITDPKAVRAALQGSAVPKDDPNKFGAGILNAGAAAQRAHWMHFGIRAFALIALAWLVARRIKKSGGESKLGMSGIVAAAFAGLGLFFFAPMTGFLPRLGHLRWVGELAMRPFGEWDLVFSAGFHRWLPLANALPTVALTALLFGVKRLRPIVGGFALGTAALLVQLAWSAEVATPFGSLVMRLWTIANALLCLWIARLALDQKAS